MTRSLCEDSVPGCNFDHSAGKSSGKSFRPFERRYDVAIMGGGLCGIGAALTLARNGKKVIICERRPLLGWEITAAYTCNLDASASAAVHRIRRAISAVYGLQGDAVDAVVAEVALDNLAESYGIDVLLYSTPTDLIAESGRVTGVVIGNKAGEQVVQADVYVDATEEALVWHLTDMAWGTGDTPHVCQSFFFNRAEPGMDLPSALGDASAHVRDVRLYGSVRKGEVRVEYTVPDGSISRARLLYPDAVAFVRKTVSQLADGPATHEGLEPLPIGAAQLPVEPGSRHATFQNLYGAGIWAIADAEERVRATQPAKRIEIGEATAQAILTATPPAQSKTGPSKRRRDVAELPVRECDVLIVGGGTGGSLGGIVSGRQGVRTILLEATTFQGGIATGSGMNWGGHGVHGGFQDEFHARIKEVLPLYEAAYSADKIHRPPDEIGAGGATYADLEQTTAAPTSGCPFLAYPAGAGRVVLESLSAEAGTERVYGATAIGVEMNGRRVIGVVAATPSGKTLYRAKVVIDCTGDADVARMAGAPLTIGRDYDGVLHCYSQVCALFTTRGVVNITNWDSGFVDPWDIVDLTRARREGIRQVWDRFAPDPFGFRPLLYLCPLLGLRGGPQIVGDYVPDFLEGILPVEFDDCVGYSAAKFDCHSQDFENHQDGPMLWVWLLGNRERRMGGQLPYRMMLPKDVDGVLVACRGASCTHEHNYQFRTMRNQHRLAEVAAYAAAQCVKRGITPRQVDVRLVQAELRKSGALSESLKPKPVVPAMPLDQCCERLASDDPKDAVWLLAHGGEPAQRLLKEALKTGEHGARFWASVALAWQRDEAALPELVKAVDERLSKRPDYTPRSRNMVPLWQSCIVLLGRIGSATAVPALLDVLADRTVAFDALIATLRALGRIGDQRAVSPILELLKRDDIACERKLQIYSLNGRWPQCEDVFWQLELAAAEILGRLGHPQRHIAEKYVQSPHSQARRYAAMVLKI
ncbi:MAG: FAD-dependent oxidoreductase [Lentisphaerae bacterium]|nr:FAD-dependent oxidoreductase [Lentisphaerota bacterium]